MVTNFWLYDSIIYIYALSLLFYFTDAVSRNVGAKRMGEGLLVFVWVLQTLFFFVRMYEHRYIPVFTKFETMFFFSWLLVTVSLAASRFFALQFVVFFVNVFGFAVLVLNLLASPGVEPARSEATAGLLSLHVALAISSYAAYALSAVLSGFYLFLQHRLKQKRWTDALRRLPSLETLERHALNAALVGTPTLLLSLALGIVWLGLQGGMGALLHDAKVYGTAAVLLLYGWQFFQKYRRRAAGRKLAIWNVATFLLLLLNFGVTNDFSKLHPWM
ncbi:cytochrome c biogenesis protein CcsA [Paenibacillus sp.]|uniref:cytochrome c biogenesis protein CcsA n=1 Tax=Paenibacillus sp. TaxID=58172 RepID=UPI002D635D74|nr:cytochrome c biogenesis protein CcsA [Paenibacillus sp.]HZG87074.1 cytochrome c biogenesis protein CcsA [Paenibacillus sp.]